MTTTAPAPRPYTYDQAKASVASYRKAQAAITKRLRTIQEVRWLKEQQASLKRSGDTEAREAHIAEHGAQHDLSKLVHNAKTSIRNQRRKLERMEARVRDEDRHLLSPTFDENDFHLETGLHMETYDFFGPDGLDKEGRTREEVVNAGEELDKHE